MSTRQARNLLLLFYALTAISLGCLPVMSLHPLYQEKDLAFEKELLGTWIDGDDPNDPDSTWQFARSDDSKKQYQLIVTDEDGRKGVFAANLVKLDNLLVLDIHPEKFPSGAETVEDMNLPYNAFFFIPVHTFVKIDFITPIIDIGKHIDKPDPNALKKLSEDHDYAMVLRLTDDDDFEKLLKSDPNAIAYQKIENHGILLTASTKQLQKFVAKYADHKEFFSKDTELIRKKSSDRIHPSSGPKKPPKKQN